MKYVVVLAGNRVQFQNFINVVGTKKMFTHERFNQVVFEGVTFLHITAAHQLRGRELGENAELVKVGTWYAALSQVEVMEIEKEFEIRKR